MTDTRHCEIGRRVRAEQAVVVAHRTRLATTSVPILIVAQALAQTRAGRTYQTNDHLEPTALDIENARRILTELDSHWWEHQKYRH